MSHVIGRGRYARETYPTAPGTGGAGAPGAATSFTTSLSTRAFAPNLYALPNDNGPAKVLPATGVIQAYFVAARDTTLSAIHVQGRSVDLGTTNTVVNGVTPVPIPIELWINDVMVATLVTIPAGATDFDVSASPGIAIPVNSSVQIVVDLSGATSGVLSNILVGWSI